MKIELGTVGVGIGAALVVVVAAVLVARRFVPAIASAVNPANPENIFNEGASSVVREISGGAASGGEETIGGALARFREWISGDDARIRKMLEGAKPTSSSTAAWDPWP